MNPPSPPDPEGGLPRPARPTPKALLQETRERLELATRAAGLAPWDWDVTTSHINWSPEIFELFGLDPKTHTATFAAWESILHPDDHEVAVAAIRQSMREHTPLNSDYRIIKSDGSVHWIRVLGQTYYDKAGQAQRMSGVCMDVTDRRSAQEALRQAKEQIEAHITHSPLAMIQFDPTFRVTRWSEAAERIFGWTSEEILAKAIGEMPWVHPEDEATVKKVSEEMRTGQRPRNVSVNRNYRKDGAVITCEWYNSALYDPAGRLTSVLSQVLDITERKRAEARLQEALKRLKLATDAGSIGTWIWSFADDRLEWDDRLCAWYDVPEADRQAHRYYDHWRSRLHPDDRAHAEAVAAESRRRDLPGEDEFRVVRPDGSIRYLHSAWVFEHDASGKPVRMVGINRDITERKQMALRLSQSQKMEALGHLTGGMAHVFNNLLAAVTLNLGLAQMVELDAEAREYVSAAEERCRKAAALIKQLLAFSRQAMIQPKPLDLALVVSRQAQMLHQVLGRGITVEFASPEGLPRVKADRQMLEQVVLNLCFNARDAMPKGGTVRIELAPVELQKFPPQAPGSARAGQHVCMSIADTGCGMDAATQARLFEPFFTTKDITKAMGLGLPVSRGIVEQHQGWMEVESVVGQGSTFRVYLPAMAPPLPPPAIATEGDSLRRGGVILVVEDEPDIRELTCQFLTCKGYTVLEASNVAAALALWQERQSEIDLVYTDYVMPGDLSGIELAKRVVAERPDIKVIVTSGHGSEMPDMAAIAQSSIAYLPKLSPPDALLAVIQAFLDHPKTQLR